MATALTVQHGDARRRYSEFEALRVVLGKLYPVLIIPPIPPHHSLGDYAAKQSKAKEDAQVIARRRRMLATFLNRLNRHPILSRERVFLRFLDLPQGIRKRLPVDVDRTTQNSYRWCLHFTNYIY